MQNLRGGRGRGCDRNQRFVDCAAFAQALRVCLSELGGAYADTDYRAWLARLAGNLSVPKPLPLLAEEAVQRTESVPAVSAHNPALDPTLIRPVLTDPVDDQTIELQSITDLESNGVLLQPAAGCGRLQFRSPAATCRKSK